MGIARLLKTFPSALYQLNALLYPLARLEFNVQHSPLTSLVLKMSNTSRIVLLDPQNSTSCAFHNLTIFGLEDILVNRTAGDEIYDELHNAVDPALRDCLAQLAQDVRIPIALQPVPLTCVPQVIR